MYNEMTDMPYCVAIQQMAKQYNLNPGMLEKMTKAEDQDPFDPITIEQCFIIDTAVHALNDDLPALTAFTDTIEEYKRRKLPTPDQKTSDIFIRIQSYYAVQHFDELTTPLNSAIIETFEQEHKAQFEQATNMKLWQVPRLVLTLIPRAVRRDMMALKNKPLESATIDDIREVINDKNSTIWAELGIQNPYLN